MPPPWDYTKQNICSDLFLFWLDQALSLAADQLFQKEMEQETDKPLQKAPCFVLSHQFIKKVTYLPVESISVYKGKFTCYKE